jgi:hypothetical protein
LVTYTERARRWWITRGRTLWAEGAKSAAFRAWGRAGAITRVLNKRTREIYQRVYPDPEPLALKMTRLTVGLNYVVRGQYYSQIVQRWGHREDLERIENLMKLMVLKEVAKDVGFTRDKWWFPDVPNVAYDTVAYAADLIDDRTGPIKEFIRSS